MPKTYWIYIPFKQSEAGDFAPDATRVMSWRATVPQKINHDGFAKQIVVAYRDTAESFADAKSTDTVYIFGHGLKELNCIYSKKPPDGAKEVSGKVATQLVKERMLPLSFDGKVKAYTCDSAKGTANNPQMCFAAHLAKCLGDDGMTNAKFFGYEGHIDGYYTSLAERKQYILDENAQKREDARKKELPEPPGLVDAFADLPKFKNEEIRRWFHTIVKFEDGDKNVLQRAKEVRVRFDSKGQRVSD